MAEPVAKAQHNGGGKTLLHNWVEEVRGIACEVNDKRRVQEEGEDTNGNDIGRNTAREFKSGHTVRLI